MCVYHVHTWCPRKSEEGLWCPDARVLGGLKLPCGFWAPNRGPPQERQVLLTSKSSAASVYAKRVKIIRWHEILWICYFYFAKSVSVRHLSKYTASWIGGTGAFTLNYMWIKGSSCLLCLYIVPCPLRRVYSHILNFSQPLLSTAWE